MWFRAYCDSHASAAERETMTDQIDALRATWLGRLGHHAVFLAILGSAMLLRLILAYVAFPGQGYATDLQQFASWASTIAAHGPGSFYQSSGANYPPGYMYVLWLIGAASGPVGSLFGIPTGDATLLLLKLPPMIADAAIGFLLYRAGTSWFGRTAGLVAAALYLFLPVSWYDSALWGQVDAVGSLLMLAAVLALADGWSEPAMALAVAGVLVKPQGTICLVVVVPILVRRHLLRVGSGPLQQLGPRLARLNRRLHGALTYQGPLRIVSTLGVATLVGIAPLLPFDIQTFAPANLQGDLIVGHVSGLLGLFNSVSGQYSVLTANAFNVWSLAGSAPLASIAAGGGSWTPDTMTVLGGISAVQLGGALLVLVGMAVAAGLLLRDDRLSILLGFAVVAFAFYALPTRVHERYLFPLYPVGALLVCSFPVGIAAYTTTAVLNAINLHAVLGSSSQIGGFGRAVQHGGGLGAGGFGGEASGSAASISLPFVDLARSEVVVAAVAIGQTLAFAVLLAVWLVYAFGPIARSRRNARQPTAARPTRSALDRWWAVQDSNLRHPRCKRGALTAELTARNAAGAAQGRN